ncbi:MAG: GHMP kinase, partial [TACK group archaeon]|nr:GHMP kinase [TACK group archaeon]
KMSEKISDEAIDRAYDTLLNAGGLGGKIQGAGGGGFLLMFTKKDKRGEVIKEAMKMNLEPFSFRFEKEGVKAWRI